MGFPPVRSNVRIVARYILRPAPDMRLSWNSVNHADSGIRRYVSAETPVGMV